MIKDKFATEALGKECAAFSFVRYPGDNVKGVLFCIHETYGPGPGDGADLNNILGHIPLDIEGIEMCIQGFQRILACVKGEIPFDNNQELIHTANQN
jgi:hypothetical protein